MWKLNNLSFSGNFFNDAHQEMLIDEACHLVKRFYHTIFIQVIRLKTTNPGKWFIHCHIEVHAIEGMGWY